MSVKALRAPLGKPVHRARILILVIQLEDVVEEEDGYALVNIYEHCALNVFGLIILEC